MKLIAKQIISIGDDNDIIFPVEKDNKNKCSLSKEVRQKIEDDTEFSMVVTNDPDDRIRIGFGDSDLNDPEAAAMDRDAFSIVVEQSTLKEMINTLQIVYDSFFE